jgi:hypothetical protein|tara:strand:+ start:399 stop:578 length:180 start_codon:yes stop_codon:yes gene_type:complete
MKLKSEVLTKLEKASDLLYLLSYALEKNLNKLDVSPTWTKSGKKLSREIDLLLKEQTRL